MSASTSISYWMAYTEFISGLKDIGALACSNQILWVKCWHFHKTGSLQWNFLRGGQRVGKSKLTFPFPFISVFPNELDKPSVYFSTLRTSGHERTPHWEYNFIHPIFGGTMHLSRDICFILMAKTRLPLMLLARASCPQRELREAAPYFVNQGSGTW